MRLLWVRLAIGVLAALAFGLPLPAGATALLDQSGVPFVLDAHREPVVVTFVATRCTDACPIANAILSAASAKATRAHVRATFVTATLDPGYDTPFVMAEYAQRFGADPHRWHFISGGRAGILALMHRFGVVANGREHASAVYVIRRERGAALVRTLLLSSDAPDRILDILRKAQL